MFPATRLGHSILATGTLVVALAVLLLPVTFRMTDLGIAHGHAGIGLGSDGAQQPSGNGTLLHVGGCKFVGHFSICSQKVLSYDHAHGLRLTATVTSRPPSGI